ncbi:Uncharacterised protein [Anaerotruncus colihominis]|uniref:Uncharacterized protein n=1 Tax=Anaerotruncus colihominis TaxID=169435 RepID=A0A174P3Y4_9FIRM|nr:Uncharacterised protein [Anaerotruncus colihominis]
MPEPLWHRLHGQVNILCGDRENSHFGTYANNTRRFFGRIVWLCPNPDAFRRCERPFAFVKERPQGGIPLGRSVSFAGLLCQLDKFTVLNFDFYKRLVNIADFIKLRVACYAGIIQLVKLVLHSGAVCGAGGFDRF